jgi:hypothetical protein
MNLAIARRLRVDPERVRAHCGRHILSLNRQGLIEPEKDGYYYNATRFLSRFNLSTAGTRAKPVSCANIEPHATVAYYLVPTPAGRRAAPPGDDDPSGGEIVAKGIEIEVDTFVGGGFHCDVFVTNRGLAEATVPLDFALDADFADIEEVTSGRRRQDAPVTRRFEASAEGKGELSLTYAHPKLNHAIKITLAAPGEVTEEKGAIRVRLRLEPQRTARIEVDGAPEFQGERHQPWFGPGGEPADPRLARRREWLANTTEFEVTNPLVQTAWARAATDLYSLHALEGEGDEIYTPIAGIPKYAGLFGRDSLVSSIQSAPLNRASLNGALRSVASGQRKHTTTDTMPSPARCCISASSTRLRFSA